MAKHIMAQVLGGGPRELHDLDTVGEVRKELKLDKGYAATINGEPAEDSDDVEDYQVVMFAPAVKGGK